MRRLLLLLVCLLLPTVATAQDASDAIDFAYVNVIAWSPTGQYLATGHYNGGLALWDGETGALIRQYALTSIVYPDFTPDIWDLAWNPDGTRLALRLFYPDTGSVVQVLEIPNGTVVLDGIEGGAFSQLALSPDGTQLAVPFTRYSNDATEIRIHDANSGQRLQTLETPYGASLGQLRWNLVGTRLAVDYAMNTESGVMIWDTNSREKQLVIPHPTTLNSFDWSPNGDRIASVDMDYVLRIWDANNGNLINSFDDASMYNVDWHPTADILGIQRGGDIAILDANTGKVIHNFSDAAGSMLSWRPDGTRLATFAATPIFFTLDGQLLPQFPSIIRCTVVETSSDTLLVSINDGEKVDIEPLENVENLVIRAFTPSYAPVQSIGFDLNGQQITDSEAPFEITLPPPGDYTLTGIPYTEPNGTGQAGTPLTVRFSVVEGSAQK